MSTIPVENNGFEYLSTDFKVTSCTGCTGFWGVLTGYRGGYWIAEVVASRREYDIYQ
ncbi:hypothetical protein PM082_004231 [Marasmius tenuissimus]|nr:hypothetical protein PM082_004231 [Marasmius tenuissimus]